MSKITKKQLHNGWHCHDTEIIKMKKELRELKQSVLRLEKLTDEKLLDDPQLKQLDQSVFDGLDEKWRFAAANSDGSRVVFTSNNITQTYGKHYVNARSGEAKQVLGRVDASNWQNSLIERDTAKELLEVGLSSELTGSELCRAMLARGDKYVMCLVGRDADPHCHNHSFKEIAYKYSNLERCFCLIGGGRYKYATPINNQGEPLTASEVGL